MNSPLKGVRVVDLTNYLAGPSTGRTLHDWGAEVIKVENTFGDMTRHVTGPQDVNEIGFDSENYGKTLVSIDMESPEGAEILDKLIATADVFLSSYRQVALDGMGLDYETLHKKYPKLVWAHLTGYGDVGPYKDAPGYDMTAYWAMTGLQRSITPPDAPNIMKAPGGFGDLNTGFALAGGIAAALYERTNTGVGEKVTLSIYGQAIWAMSFMLWDLQNGNSYPRSRLQIDYPLMNFFRCKDDKWIYMGLMDHDRSFGRCMKVLGREDLIDDKRFNTMVEAFKHLPELYETIDPVFLKKDSKEWIKELAAANIPVTPVNEITDLINDPAALENEYILEYTLRDGKSKRKMGTTPLRFGDDKAPAYKPAGKLGTDTAKVLRELGYSESDIQSYADKKIIVARDL
ncbi:MAG: CaiB/BaiF CoA transferase family protein [Anaerovoracaceae bacterium]|jgi:crotonobetainyl-CoA:carnitine CoA-transferase CaiB-like acyl-CoA transferase